MANIERAQRALLSRVLQGEGDASPSDRQTAFDNGGRSEPWAKLVSKVCSNARQVTDNVIADAKQSGLSEDQIFELVVCAAIGEASRQQDIAKTALEEAMVK